MALEASQFNQQVTATIGGKPILASSDLQIRFTPGIQPTIFEVSVTPWDAEELLKQARGEGNTPLRNTNITIRRGNIVQTFSYLFVLSEAPRQDPNIAVLRVADRRWLWQYAHVLRRYNMRRNVGYYRIQANDVQELERTEEDIQYAKYSLKAAGGYWSASEIISDVVEYVVKQVETALFAGIAGVDPGDAFAQFSPAIQIDLPTDAGDGAGHRIENLEIDDRGDYAIGRTLQTIPGADITLTNTGRIIVYSRSSIEDDGNDEAPARKVVMSRIDKSVVGRGVITSVDYSVEAPKKIEVLFTPEFELRLDFNTDPASLTANDLRRSIDNVVAVPDYTLTINGQTAVQGEYHEINEYMAALDSPQGPYGNRINDWYLRYAFLPFSSVWSQITEWGTIRFDAQWGARVQALQRSWRQMFRINRKLWDNIYSIRPYRVGTVNQATGARSPAMIYGDYLVVPSERAHWKQYSETGNSRFVYMQNVKSYQDVLDSDAYPAPASISIEDPDQGIVYANYMLDPYRLREMVIPGSMDEDSIPGFHRVGQHDSEILMNTVSRVGRRLAQIEQIYKASIILTAVPAAPNSTRNLFRVVVSPDDMKDMKIPDGVKKAANTAKGPWMQIRVPAQIETARLRWLDDRKEDIEYFFGMVDTPGGPDHFTRERRIRSLCVNLDKPQQEAGAPPQQGNGASLNNIARAVAARMWATFAPHEAGNVTTRMDDRIHPVGWMERATHTFTTKGEAFTTVEMPTRYPDLDFTALLDPGTRAVVLRQTQMTR